MRTGADGVEGLNPAWVRPMHGGSLPGDVVPAYTRALREEGFAFDGRMFGRRITG
ncbi:MAG: hypothetical protein M3Q60_00205 [Actinomycetota bacterium]|nr:hypothetical protein [Actinomycetota bacterium]